MHVSSMKTVSLDATEIRDIIAEHLRSKGVLPDGQKFKIYALDVPGAQLIGGAPGVELTRPESLRIAVKWSQ